MWVCENRGNRHRERVTPPVQIPTKPNGCCQESTPRITGLGRHGYFFFGNARVAPPEIPPSISMSWPVM